MAWYYWAGGAAALAGAALIMRGGQKQADNSADASTSGGLTTMGSPLFMASGGGTSQGSSDTSVSGAIASNPAHVPLSENVDYQIALLNQAVNLAAIQAGKDVQLAGIAITNPNTTTTTSGSEFRNNSIAAGADYIKNQIAQQPKIGVASVEQNIYAAAKANNYSATEVAQAYSDATGQKITAKNVNDWISSRNLAAL